MSSLRFSAEHYRLTTSLESILNPDDNIFISSKGTFVCRGYVASYPQSDIVRVLSEINTEALHEQKPFAIFSQPFHNQNSRDCDVTLPSEMIHVDDHGWVTHYRSDSESTIQTPVRSEHPHHVEMMSPESKDQFIDKVETVLKHIEIGDVTKVVIARQLNVTADVPIDPRLLVTELVDSQPESYVYSVSGFVGASPELLVEKSGRTIRCLPMAGTRRRHARIDEDDADIADLQTNEKDRTEHHVVIEDIIEKLNSVASNVSASDVPHVVRLPHVAHLATSVTATAGSETDLLSFVSALHPTPAVAGTPTEVAVSLIEDIEGFDRGIYGSPVGYIDASGDGQCAIALRCARVQGTHAQLFAGVGIVAGSDPDKEWDETQAKFGVMRDAMMNITQ